MDFLPKSLLEVEEVVFVYLVFVTDDEKVKIASFIV